VAHSHFTNQPPTEPSAIPLAALGHDSLGGTLAPAFSGNLGGGTDGGDVPPPLLDGRMSHGGGTGGGAYLATTTCLHGPKAAMEILDFLIELTKRREENQTLEQLEESASFALQMVQAGACIARRVRSLTTSHVTELHSVWVVWLSGGCLWHYTFMASLSTIAMQLWPD
jgi:hypothetical protein